MNIRRILCPIDFSEPNISANKVASLLAEIWQASIVYLTVPSQAAGDDYSAAMERTAARELKRLEAYAPTRPDVEFSHAVKISSRTAQAIVDYADDQNQQIDLIVMATRGRTGVRRMLMGSVAEGVVRKANCPVLTVKSDVQNFGEACQRRDQTDGGQSAATAQVLCAVDIGDYDQQLIDLAAAMAKQFRVEFHVLHVTLSPDPLGTTWPGYLGTPAELITDNERLRSLATGVKGVPIHTHHLSGFPVERILGFVERNPPLLLVLGTHARRGIQRLFGSVAEQVMRQAACPVVVIRQAQNVAAAKSTDVAKSTEGFSD